MAGAVILVGTELNVSALTAAFDQALLSHGGASPGSDTVITRSFGEACAEAVPIVSSLGRTEAPFPARYAQVVALGAMCNRAADHTALLSLALEIASRTSGILALTASAPAPSHRGLVSCSPVGGLGRATTGPYSVVLSPEATTAWLEDGSLELVKYERSGT